MDIMLNIVSLVDGAQVLFELVDLTLEWTRLAICTPRPASIESTLPTVAQLRVGDNALDRRYSPGN